MEKKRRRFSLTSGIPKAGKVEINLVGTLLSQQYYQETAGETTISLKDFILSLKVSITWTGLSLPYRKNLLAHTII